MPGRVIAIGDIHGCAAALRALLDAIDPEADDSIITLGDCVDRGPESCQVIEELLQLRERCRLIPLLGNHEEMMLNFLEGRPQPDEWLLCGGRETVESYRDESGKQGRVPVLHVDYIRTWMNYCETPSHFFCHASYDPEKPLAQQHWQTMRWLSLKHIIPEAHLSGKTAIVGHSSQKSGEIFDIGHLLCIDTFCWGGGWLTAMDTTTGQIWQANRDGRLRQNNLPAQPAKPR
jgi:serine/threonine protein phosphatase 1